MSRNPATIAMAQRKGVDANVLADKIQQKAEKYAAVLRFGSVLISGLFLSVVYFRMKRYYVEHLIFSLHYYSFDFLCKSIFALIYLIAAAVGAKLPTLLLNFFYPVAFLYFMLALRRVYRQGWPVTAVKAVLLFALETLLFIAVNVAGFIIAFAMV